MTDVPKYDCQDYESEKVAKWSDLAISSRSTTAQQLLEGAEKARFPSRRARR
jgi:hypothetical protein